MSQVILMVVDDSEIDRYIIRRLLQKSGSDATLVECHDGAQAIQWLIGNRLDETTRLFVLLDINMPVMNGFECLAQLSRLREKRADLDRLSVAVLTSSNHPEDLHRSIAYPFVDRHLVKMPSADELRDMLSETVPGDAPAPA